MVVIFEQLTTVEASDTQRKWRGEQGLNSQHAEGIVVRQTVCQAAGI